MSNLPKSSLEVADEASAAVVVAPRVSIAFIESRIKSKYEYTAAQMLETLSVAPLDSSLSILSICILIMENGFTVIGKAAPASAENFNRDLGKKFAYEDAIRQLWPLEGYSLRDRLLVEDGDAP